MKRFFSSTYPPRQLTWEIGGSLEPSSWTEVCSGNCRPPKEICEIGGKSRDVKPVPLRPFKALVWDMCCFFSSPIFFSLLACSNSSGSKRFCGKQSICEMRGNFTVSILEKVPIKTRQHSTSSGHRLAEWIQFPTGLFLKSLKIKQNKFTLICFDPNGSLKTHYVISRSFSLTTQYKITWRSLILVHVTK